MTSWKIPVSNNSEIISQLAGFGIPFPENFNTMTKQTIIPAGYRITIRSWENDMDNCQSITHEGLTKERVQFIIALCKLFYSKNSKKGCFGNTYDPSEHELQKAIEAILQVLADHRSVLATHEADMLALQGEEFDIDDVRYEFQDLVSDYLGNSDGEFAFRVFDGAVVESVPQEIHLVNASEEFGV